VSTTISDDLEVTLASDDRFAAEQNRALVSLCRLLAEQIDDAGEKASNRLTAAYLSALKDLNRILTAEQRGGRAHDSSDEGPSLGSLRSNLTALRSA
jgi:hypothetical protein